MSLLQLLIAVTFAVIASTAGDLLIAKGMRKVGEVSWLGWRGTLRLVIKIATRPEILAAIACMTIFFFTWLALLSRADLSLILPMTALTYILNGLAAKPVLGEVVSPQRWAGIMIITIGVVFVTLSST